MNGPERPPWLEALTSDELLFVKRFLLASGSLKGLASVYGVSYPTIRARLDRLIEKVTACESTAGADSFERLLELLVEQGVMANGTARALLQTHRRVLREATERAERNATAIGPPDAFQE